MRYVHKSCLQNLQVLHYNLYLHLLCELHIMSLLGMAHHVFDWSPQREGLEGRPYAILYVSQLECTLTCHVSFV